MTDEGARDEAREAWLALSQLIVAHCEEHLACDFVTCDGTVNPALVAAKRRYDTAVERAALTRLAQQAVPLTMTAEEEAWERRHLDAAAGVHSALDSVRAWVRELDATRAALTAARSAQTETRGLVCDLLRAAECTRGCDLVRVEDGDRSERRCSCGAAALRARVYDWLAAYPAEGETAGDTPEKRLVENFKAHAAKILQAAHDAGFDGAAAFAALPWSLCYVPTQPIPLSGTERSGVEEE